MKIKYVINQIKFIMESKQLMKYRTVEKKKKKKKKTWERVYIGIAFYTIPLFTIETIF